MTSELPTAPDRLFVWAWLPGATQPTPAGVLERVDRGAIDPVLTFAYARSWVEAQRPPLYLPELPVRTGRQEPPAGMKLHGVLRDAGPDAWGQRVVMRRLLARDARDRDPAELSILTYLLHSGSDRAGALDFQLTADEYVPRTHEAPLEVLLDAADRIQADAPLPPEVAEPLQAGSSVGGARPKATLRDGNRAIIAKFSAPTDLYPVMRAEAVAMDLAARAGCDVATVDLVEVAGRDVLLVDRFDRGPNGQRHEFVSALTLFGLDEMMGRYGSYPMLADALRQRTPVRRQQLHELFRRIVVNVLVGNTDDHARNHAVFYDATADEIRLTPAYDICPQLRTGGEATQALAIGADGQRLAKLTTCINAAAWYDLSAAEAKAVVDEVLTTIAEQWHEAADRACLTAQQRDALWGRQIVNRYATDGYCNPVAQPPTG